MGCTYLKLDKNMKSLSLKPTMLLLGSMLTLSLQTSHATTSWNAGNVGLWNDAVNWSAGVPGSPDTTARMNSGGTANVTVANPAPNGAGTVNFRMNNNNNTAANIVNWNPGTDYIFREIWVGNEDSGSAAFNHDSGTIRADTSWYHIGRRGTATYTMTGTSTIQPDDRLSIGEGANNQATDAYLIMSGNSSIDGQTTSGNNDYLIGQGGTGGTSGTLIMSENASANVPRWDIGNNNSAQGTVIMNDTTTMTVELQTEVGKNSTAQGHITLNQSARWTGNQFGFSIWNSDGGASRDTQSSLTMNDNTFLSASGWFELGGGQATFTMNGNAEADLNGNVRIGMRATTATVPGDGISRLIMNENSRLRGEGGDFYVGLRPNSKGLIQVNDDAVLTDNGILAVGSQGTGALEINNNGSVSIGSWLAIGHNANAPAGADGTVTVNGGTLYAGELLVGENHRGTLNITGGSVTVGNNMDLARNHNTQTDSVEAIVNQSGGTVTIGSFLQLEQRNTTGGEGTYNLTGGTLRVNDIRMGNGAAQGVFNWTTGGTLTMKEPGVGQSGVGGGGFGGAGVGTTIAVDANGQTFATGAGAILDLGNVYQNNGIGFDVLAVTGNLDLTAAGDVLDFWDNVNLIRPGGNTTTTGEYQLISVTGTMSGQFDSVIGPSTLGQFFQFYQTGPTAVPLGTSADALRRNTGYIDYRADGAYFVFKVGGQIPEPQTTAFLFLGVVLLRGVAVMKRNNNLRQKMDI